MLRASQRPTQQCQLGGGDSQTTKQNANHINTSSPNDMVALEREGRCPIATKMTTRQRTDVLWTAKPPHATHTHTCTHTHRCVIQLACRPCAGSLEVSPTAKRRAHQRSTDRVGWTPLPLQPLCDWPTQPAQRCPRTAAAFWGCPTHTPTHCAAHRHTCEAWIPAWKSKSSKPWELRGRGRGHGRMMRMGQQRRVQRHRDRRGTAGTRGCVGHGHWGPSRS